jgi:hypothetical protein
MEDLNYENFRMDRLFPKTATTDIKSMLPGKDAPAHPQTDFHPSNCDEYNRSARPKDENPKVKRTDNASPWARGPPLSDQGCNLSPPTPYAFRLPDAVAYSGLGKSFLYDCIRRGQLVSVKVAGRRLILRADLEALIHGRTSTTSNQEAP